MSVDTGPAARRPRIRPSSADAAFAAIGGLALLASAFALPIPHPDMAARAVFRLLMFVVGVVLAVAVALVFRGFRGDWRGFTIWCGKLWLALAVLFIASRVRDLAGGRPAALIAALGERQITIDRFVRAERAAAPGLFDQRLLRNNERALRESFPDGEFEDVSIADVTDGPDWMRVRMTYRGTFKVQGESVTSAAQIVLYYHRAGMAVITAACTTAPRDCAQIEPLLAAAERSLRARFAAPDLDEVLPESKQCSVETLDLPNSDDDSRVRACVYAPGIQLTLTRVDADATIRLLIAERAAQ
jgi:hypothetical protein